MCICGFVHQYVLFINSIENLMIKRLELRLKKMIAREAMGNDDEDEDEESDYMDEKEKLR